MKPLFVLLCVFLGCATVRGGTVQNGGFETNDFSSWSTLGITSVQGQFSGIDPVEGGFQAVLRTNTLSTASQDTVESFLELDPGTLDSISTQFGPEGGSVIKQVFDLADGETISFQYNFIANGGSSGEQNDSAFYVLHLAGTNSGAFNLLSQSTAVGGGSTGYTLVTTGPLSAGTYLLGFAVYDRSPGTISNLGNPDLLIDSVVPEPSTITLLAGGALVALVCRRFRRRK